MRIVTDVTTAGCHRAVNKLLTERSAVMAAKAKPGPVFTVIQEKASAGTVRIMTSYAVPILEWRMLLLLFHKFIVTRFAEISRLGGKPKTFSTLERMFLNSLLVTGKTVSILKGLMRVFKSGDSGMAGYG